MSFLNGSRLLFALCGAVVNISVAVLSTMGTRVNAEIALADVSDASHTSHTYEVPKDLSLVRRASFPLSFEIYMQCGDRLGARLQLMYGVFDSTH